MTRKRTPYKLPPNRTRCNKRTLGKPAPQVLKVGPGTWQSELLKSETRYCNWDGSTYGCRSHEVCSGEVCCCNIPSSFHGFTCFIGWATDEHTVPDIFAAHFSSSLPLPDAAVAILMFRREIFQRLVAPPETKLWSRLSANVQLRSKVDMVIT